MTAKWQMGHCVVLWTSQTRQSEIQFEELVHFQFLSFDYLSLSICPSVLKPVLLQTSFSLHFFIRFQNLKTCHANKVCLAFLVNKFSLCISFNPTSLNSKLQFWILLATAIQIKLECGNWTQPFLKLKARVIQVFIKCVFWDWAMKCTLLLFDLMKLTVPEYVVVLRVPTTN